MSDDPDAPVLVLSDEWVIDEMAQDRMARQLARAPVHVAGVAADTGALPSGASYRVHAERLTLQPPSAISDTGSHRARGAVLVRPGVAVDVDGDVIEVESGPLWIDYGVHVHDPWQALASLAPATPLGRPPFPRRPVVVLLACEDDLDLADWARRRTNDLVRRDVEGRLAVPEAPEGLHLTQPCLPTAETIRALAPDAIVALDETALSCAPDWCADNRATVLVELVLGHAGSIELMSWRLGNASGRLRARVDDGVGARELAGLVKRLCGGPHPAPPVEMDLPDAEVAALLPTLTARPRVAQRSLVIVSATAEPSRRMLGFVDHVPIARGHAELTTVDKPSPATATADVVLLTSVTGHPGVRELVEARARDGRPTVVDLGATDVEPLMPGAPPVLTPDAIWIVGACGLATTPSPALQLVVRELGVRAQLLPTLLERARVVTLRQAREALLEPKEQTGPRAEQEQEEESEQEALALGWHVAGGPPDALAAMVDAVRSVTNDRPGLYLQLAGDTARLPQTLLAEPWVRVIGEPDPESLVGWAAQLWNPSRVEYEVAGDQRPLIEAGVAGVQTVTSVDGRAANDDHVVHEVLVEHAGQAEAWLAHLHPLVHDANERGVRSRLVTQRADALFSPTSSAGVVNRFLGWALHGATSR